MFYLNWILLFKAVIGSQKNWRQGAEVSRRRPPHTRVACRVASLLRESRTFVTNHEPALSHHCHPEPMVYLDFVRGAVHCMSLDKCTVTRVHDDSIIQSSLTALKTLCSACHPSRAPTPGNHWSSYSLHTFAFSRVLYSWIHAACAFFISASFIQYYAFTFTPCLFRAW